MAFEYDSSCGASEAKSREEGEIGVGMVLGGGTGGHGEYDRVSAGEEVELISGKGGGGGIRKRGGDCVTKRRRW